MDRLKTYSILLVSGCMSFGMLAHADNYNNTPSQNGAPAAVQTDTTTPGTPATQTTSSASDTAILQSLQAALAHFKDKVNVTVTDGIASLSGKVDSDTDYEKIITLTESTPGIKDVNVDNLTVKDSQQPLKDTYITAKIKGALIKADIMDKDLPAWTLSVETKDGVVYLSGDVASAQQKQSILNLVNGVQGVSGVKDRMVIASSDAAANQGSTTDNQTSSVYE
ncbi:BON domain-containing protein [Legionella spiritensis]|uniref:BON domain-containing protein n=1 Tax=Legionella spiritensis TaxID=452 RepID=UPI000F6CBEDE|nr:BON domain-containing protein [Legionella spiritensis]VEG90910.1 osmotically inducible protein Y [Legionella spiritensis]